VGEGSRQKEPGHSYQEDELYSLAIASMAISSVETCEAELVIFPQPWR
jgi:hypothetical protein